MTFSYDLSTLLYMPIHNYEMTVTTLTTMIMTLTIIMTITMIINQFKKSVCEA